MINYDLPGAGVERVVAPGLKLRFCVKHKSLRF